MENAVVVNTFPTLPSLGAPPVAGEVELVGFGVLTYRGVKDAKRVVTLPVVEHSQCELIHRKPKPKMFCAGMYGKDACQGDSGAGAVQDGVLVGVVSHGKRCGGRRPGIYTDLRYFTTWIKETVASPLRPLSRGGGGKRTATI